MRVHYLNTRVNCLNSVNTVDDYRMNHIKLYRDVTRYLGIVRLNPNDGNMTYSITRLLTEYDTPTDRQINGGVINHVDKFTRNP